MNWNVQPLLRQAIRFRKLERRITCVITVFVPHRLTIFRHYLINCTLEGDFNNKSLSYKFSTADFSVILSHRGELDDFMEGSAYNVILLLGR